MSEENPSTVEELVLQKLSAADSTVQTGKVAASSQADKSSVHLAGEYYVAAELHRRGIHATLTYGNAKSADILAFSLDGERFVRVEVKTSRVDKGSVLIWSGTMERFSLAKNQFWVLCVLPRLGDDKSFPEFYVFTAEEMRGEIQNRLDSYSAKRSGTGDPTKWMWSFNVTDLRASTAKNDWAKISDYL